MVTFSVVCLAHEDDDVLHRFIAHYLRLGAANVALFIDRAQGDTPVSLAPFDEEERARILLTYCDEAYWSNLGANRPAVLEVRQRTIYMEYFKRCPRDWVLACDADEFLVSPTPLSGVLDLVPDDIESITFFPIEAVWGPHEEIDQIYGSSLFRVPFPTPKTWKRERRHVYGPERFLMSSRGLVGHHAGKSMTRTGSRADEIELHWANAEGERISVSTWRLGEPFTSVHLAHFDAINFTRWRKKFQRRGGSKGASGGRGSKRRVWQRRIANFANRLGPAAGRYVFRRFYCLTNRQLEQLKKRDLVRQAQIFER